MLWWKLIQHDFYARACYIVCFFKKDNWQLKEDFSSFKDKISLSCSSFLSLNYKGNKRWTRKDQGSKQKWSYQLAAFLWWFWSSSQSPFSSVNETCKKVIQWTGMYQLQLLVQNYCWYPLLQLEAAQESVMWSLILTKNNVEIIKEQFNKGNRFIPASMITKFYGSNAIGLWLTCIHRRKITASWMILFPFPFLF